MSGALSLSSAPEQNRRGFLGGSDAGILLGLSPWGTPLSLWGEKTGVIPREQPSRAQAQRYARGHLLEPYIRDMTVQRLKDDGHDVELLATNKRYVDPEFPFMRCEIDFEISLDGRHVNCDSKSTFGFARKAWGDDLSNEIPAHVDAQFQWGEMITDRALCVAGVLSSFDDVSIFLSERDPEIIAEMRARAIAFWNDHVLTGIAPDPTTMGDLKSLFKHDDGTAADADDELAEKIAQHKEIGNRIRLFEEARDELAYEIGSALGSHTFLNHNGYPLISWKAQQQRRLDVDALRAAHPKIAAEFTKESTVRVMRHIVPKR